jgi:hypothetical protein
MYECKVDLDGDAVEEITYRIKFDEHDAAGRQRMSLYRIDGYRRPIPMYAAKVAHRFFPNILPYTVGTSAVFGFGVMVAAMTLWMLTPELCGRALKRMIDWISRLSNAHLMMVF